MMETRASEYLALWEGTKRAFRSRFGFLSAIAWNPRAYQEHAEYLEVVSPDQLFGRKEGREWVLWFSYSPVLPRARFLAFQFSFWGCPAGQERQRLVPYFCVGPPLSLLGWKGDVTRGAEALKAARRDYGKDAVLPLAVRAPWGEVAVHSSYPPATSAMRSERWLQPLFAWYSTIQRYSRQTAFPPTFAGVRKSGGLSIPFDLSVPTDVYLAIFDELMHTIEDLESKFGVTNQAGVRPQQVVRTPTGPMAVSKCPNCGKLSPVTNVNDLFGAPLNARTTCCKALVYQQK